MVWDDGHEASPRELQAFCEQNMAHFQVPRFIRTVAELPKTQTERVEKYRLRDEGVTDNTWDGGERGRSARSESVVT